MKQKNIKVVYKSRSIGGSYTQVPKIQMEGRWLEELGFSIGSTIVVEYGEGSLHIRPMTAEELADQQRPRWKRNWLPSLPPSADSRKTFMKTPVNFPM